MNLAKFRLMRVLLTPILLFIVLNYFVRRAYSSIFERARPGLSTKHSDFSESTVSVYDTSVPIIQDLAPANTWRRMWESVPRNSRVLDLGCSTGYLGSWLAQTRNCVVDGVDVFDEDLSVAQTRLHRVHKIDLEQSGWVSIVDSPYDVVLMMDVLEHIRNTNNILQTAKKTLSPSGTLFVNVPNVANWRLRFELMRGRWNYQEKGLMDRTHVYFYTRETLRALLVANGFVVDSIEPTVPGYEVMGLTIGKSVIGSKLLVTLVETFPDLLAYQILAKAHPQKAQAT